LRTSHGSLIRRARRRRYYRRRLRLPVQLRPELHRLRRQRGTERQATIVEISGSGASITNPFSSASTGILLDLRFQVGSATMRLRGRIVRVSRNGRILHVAFENIGAAQRERIVSYLVRRARAA
jgi:c-di-GMP-binding flagellar brake protein YcgR